eukprot:scaffold50694_cov74-Cyclotella_meneghiniana.AAC.1
MVRKESIVLQNCCNCRDESRNKLTFFLKNQSFTAQPRPRIVSRSIRGVNNEGSVDDVEAEEPGSINSAVAMMCEQQLDYERDRGAIVEATATIDRTMFASSVCDGAIAISGWQMLELAVIDEKDA